MVSGSNDKCCLFLQAILNFSHRAKTEAKIHFFFFAFAFRNNVPDILHPLIQCRTLLRTVIQLVLQELCLTLRNIFLVLQLVFQTGPEIHGDGTELDFHIDQLLRILQKIGTCTIRCRLR